MANQTFEDFAEASEIKPTGFIVGFQDDEEVLYPNTLLPSGGGGLPYTSYVASFTNTGASDPTVTVINNTTGGTISWVRSTDGEYTGTISGATFTANKTISLEDKSFGVKFSNLANYRLFIDRISNTEIKIKTIAAGASSPADNYLENKLIEIRIYA